MSHRIRERAIFALIDGRLREKARIDLERHLDECKQCNAFYEQVSEAQSMLRQLDAEPPPPVDWHRVDAGIEAGLEGDKRRPLLGSVFVWGALASATAAAFLVTWLAAGGYSPPEPTAPNRMPAKVAATNPTAPPGIDTTDRQAPRTLEAFVSFVAGQVTGAGPGDAWTPLGLETPVEVGTRLRTTEHGVAGIQLGPSHACRLQPDTEIRVTHLGTPNVQLEVERGQVVCDASEPGADGETPALVLAMMDVVASAEGEARFALRRQPQITVVELAAGTLRVTPDGTPRELTAPGRVVIHTGDGERRVEEDTALAEAPSLPQTYRFPRRTIASLEIPAIDAVERVRVDGVDYGPLPLQLRRRPGMARLEMFVAGRDPIIHEVQVGFGPRVVEVAALGPLGELRATGIPSERRVAPRIGTYNKNQVRRLRSVVGSRVRGCYERVLKRNPSIWGRIRVRFTVSTSGEARRVKVSSLAGGHRDVNECIQRSLDQERFPAPLGGHVPVEQTITLSPQF